jgi:hypothetical protein
MPTRWIPRSIPATLAYAARCGRLVKDEELVWRRRELSVRFGPGLSFSGRRALGVSALRGRTGIPTTRSGLDRKSGRSFTAGLLSLLFGGRR